MECQNWDLAAGEEERRPSECVGPKSGPHSCFFWSFRDSSFHV